MSGCSRLGAFAPLAQLAEQVTLNDNATRVSTDRYRISCGFSLVRLISGDGVAKAFESPGFDQTFDTLLAELD